MQMMMVRNKGVKHEHLSGLPIAVAAKSCDLFFNKRLEAALAQRVASHPSALLPCSCSFSPPT